jgi:transcriptional regulator with XRE-family HTH domain
MPTLRELRKRSYLSQEGLAREAKVPRESISRYENGRKKPSQRTIQSLARALRVDPKQIQFPKDPGVDTVAEPVQRTSLPRERLELFRLVLDNGIRNLLPDVPETLILKYFGKKKIIDYIRKIRVENNGNFKPD